MIACWRSLLAAMLPVPLSSGLARGIEMLLTLACFGGGAYLGLCVLDGDHRNIVPMSRLSRAQILWLSLLGVLAVCPVTLVWDVILRIAGSAYAPANGFPQRPVGFTQLLLKSVLLAPVCEELFFRGYLLGALQHGGRLRAAAAASLCFALVHSPEGLLLFTLFGLLLCAVTYRTDSLLAPVLVHMGYNLTLILADSLGMPGLLRGLSLLSCLLRLVGCALFMAVLERVYTARGASGRLILWEGGELTGREKALLLTTALLLAALMILGG